jgi:YD repeat-containing protein
MPTSHGEPVDRFEADLRYGNFVLRETDLFLEDIFKVPLTRTYTSSEWVDRNPVHAFGRNSNHPYDIAPIGTRNPYTYQAIVLEDGDFLYFDRISKGAGYADSVFQHTETSSPFYKAIQRWNGKGWTTRLADGSEIRFPESYDAKNLAQGAPYEMWDAKGNRLELHRDPQRNLQEIKTPHGHWIKFSYDDSSRIRRAEDDAGHWAQYEYNADGMLKSAILSSGRERHYEYHGVLMTQITDENGHVLLHNWFRERFLQRQQFGNGAVYSYSYDWAPDEYYPKRVTVTLPDETTQELSVGASVPEFVKNYHR